MSKNEKVYEGRWKIVSKIKSGERIIGYNFENIYNHEIFYVCKNYMRDINRGELTINKLIQRRVRRRKKNMDCWGHERKELL